MKTKTLLFLSLFVCMALNVYSGNQDVESTRKEILLKSKEPNIIRGFASSNSIITSNLMIASGLSLNAGSSSYVRPTTYLMDNTVSVSFNASVTDVSILVTNDETGEVVHHEIFSSRSATTIYIPLDGCGGGVYSIEITSKAGDYSGEFVLN